MTYVPVPLSELQAYMQAKTGLPPNSLGVYPDEDHDGGYHCGWDRRRITNGSLDDYAWEESARDWNHKTNAARAFDCGSFTRLQEMSVWIVGQCKAGAPDTLDIREIIYSPDGQVVLRWDRLGIRDDGDSSHLSHTHVSFFADAEAHDKLSVFQRFFGDDVSRNTDWRLQEIIAGKEIITVPVDDTVGSPPLFTEPNVPQVQSNRMEILLNDINFKLSQLLAIPPGSANPEAVRAIVRDELDKTKLTGFANPGAL